MLTYGHLSFWLWNFFIYFFNTILPRKLSISNQYGVIWEIYKFTDYYALYYCFSLWYEGVNGKMFKVFVYIYYTLICLYKLKIKYNVLTKMDCINKWKIDECGLTSGTQRIPLVERTLQEGWNGQVIQLATEIGTSSNTNDTNLLHAQRNLLDS